MNLNNAQVWLRTQPLGRFLLAVKTAAGGRFPTRDAGQEWLTYHIASGSGPMRKISGGESVGNASSRSGGTSSSSRSGPSVVKYETPLIALAAAGQTIRVEVEISPRPVDEALELVRSEYSSKRWRVEAKVDGEYEKPILVT